MKYTCLDCKRKVLIHSKSMKDYVKFYADKGVYLCRKCRSKVILKELERRLNDQ